MSRWRRPRRPKYFACIEYWLYLHKPKLPPQNAYMTRMMRLNPLEPGAEPLLGPGDGLLFSDIRLHISLALRAKNAHVFRPDLFEAHVDPTAENLTALAECHAFAKLQYVSDDRLRDDRSLRFMPFLVEAMAALTKAPLVFDAVSEELISMETFRERLARHPNPVTSDFHLRTLWIDSELGGYGVTRGMMKVGLPEFRTPESSKEQRALILETLRAGAEAMWLSGETPDALEVTAFEDAFRLEFHYAKNGPATVRIHRIQSVSPR